MIDKRVIVLLLVMLLVFSVVSVYVYKQWKHLPQLLLKPATLPSVSPKKQVRRNDIGKGTVNKNTPKYACQNPPVKGLPPPCVIIPQNDSDKSSVNYQPFNEPSSAANVPPLQKTQEVVPEQNLDCPTFAPRVEKEYVVYADSACRDFSLYPNSQEYYFKFPLPLYNVTSVDIIQAIIPRGEYEINLNNRTFYVQEPPNAPLPVTLDIGDYVTEVALAAEITAKMNVSGLTNTYLVTGNLFKLTFTRVVGALPFQLMLTNLEYNPTVVTYDPYALVRQMLGFPPGIIPDVGGVIVAPFFTGQNSIQYVDVVSPDVSKNYYDSPEIARIPVLGGALNNVTEYDPQTIGSRKFWPVQRLTGLFLQFFVGPSCPPRSVLYNFNGMDNSLTLRITCQEYKNVFIDDFCIEQMV